MKCLLKYRWVKLPRAQLPQGKGVLGYWSRSRLGQHSEKARHVIVAITMKLCLVCGLAESSA